MRLRSFNAIGNPNFEVDQKQIGGYLTNPVAGTWLCDNWQMFKAVSTAAVDAQRVAPGFPGVSIIGISGLGNYSITNGVLVLTLKTAQATLAAGDYYTIIQTVEGPRMRELANDVHSISLLIQSDVFPLKFAVSLRDSNNARSLVKLCTLNNASYNLIPLPNLPVWASGGSWNLNAGSAGYQILITFASGTTYMTPANDTWQNGNFYGAIGMDNWLSKAVNSSIRLAFVQHEPGSNCTTLIDKPFNQNYDECLRYYQKSHPYSVKAGGVTGFAQNTGVTLGGGTTCRVTVNFPKPMAKSPTIQTFSVTNQALNTVYVDAPGQGNVGVSTVTVSEKLIAGLTLSTAATGTGWISTLFDWHADTGW